MAGGRNSTWYVSFELRRAPRPTGKRSPSRATATFASEAEARKFARTKLAEGLHVTAGTINPVLPKRTIASSKIDKWCGEF
jgi:hypothetical protein